jgi:cellobiose phosphorylase
MINPINHALDAESSAVYKVEPYVLAADVYGVAPHVGRGGWTWYTGSAGWMYRLLTESLLGLQRSGNVLRIAPCIPADWPSYRIAYRFGTARYLIDITQVDAGVPARLTVDGVAQASLSITLADDAADHSVQLLWARSPG